jgi:aminoglycoside 3-N-acetyltransferase I
MTTTIRTRRLTSADIQLAGELFALMAEAFGDDAVPLGADYLRLLLSRREFWAVAAFSGEHLAGGLTAHTLPMTRAEVGELFIYDLAVAEAFRRQGVGRALVSSLRQAAAAEGLHSAFVAADDEDTGALEFYRAIGGQPSPVTVFTFDEA